MKIYAKFQNISLKAALAISIFAAGSSALSAPHPYKMGDTEAEGYLALPTKMTGNVPAVLIVHDWMGPSEFTQKKADEIASLGYVALAVDIYGKGNSPKDVKEAGALAGKYKSDRAELRKRITVAYNELKSVKGVDAKKIVVMGYCFGGTTALELARSGANLAGVVSFHGGLANPNPADAKNIKGRALIMHGAIDPYVPAEEVVAFQKEMNDAKVDYEFIAYSGAVHAFAVPGAGNNPAMGAAYNKVADQRSWAEFKNFMKEVTQ